MNIRRFVVPTLLCVFNAPAHAETCAIASISNDLTITLPCLQIGTDVYRAGFNFLSNLNSLAWQWNGVLEPVTCTADANICTTLDSSNLGLHINALNLNGVSLNVKLAYDAVLPAASWRYVSHTVNQTTTTTLVLNDTALASIRQYMDNVTGIDKNVPGAILGIAQGSSILMAEAFGLSDASTGTAMTTDNLLHIGSTNKMLTSFMLAALVDDGILQWDTLAQEIYPAFTTANPQTASTITIRHLVNMTAGFAKDANIESGEPVRQLFDQLSAQALIGNPSEKYQYSNLSSSLAGYLGVMAVMKKDHGQITDDDMNNLYTGYVNLLKAKVLDPIGMNNSFIPVADARATGKMAKSHHLQDGRFVVSDSVENAQDNSAPSGGLKSTINDMLRYIITDMQQGVNPDGTRVASAANVGERQKLSSGPAALEEYGLSTEIKEIKGHRYVGHTGSFDNFNSVMGFFPDKQIAFVLLTNGDSPAALSLTDSGLLDTLASLLGNAQ